MWTSLTAIIGGVQVSSERAEAGQRPTLFCNLCWPDLQCCRSDQFLQSFSTRSNCQPVSSYSSPSSYDLSNSKTTTISNLSGTYYARARARLTNGDWSNWRPFGSSVTPTTTTVTINQSSYQDTSTDVQSSVTYATIQGAGGPFNTT